MPPIGRFLDRFRRAVGDKTAPPRFASALRRLDSAVFDFCKYGGAPLLGINGHCIICHGSSNALAIQNAVRVASEFVTYEINQHIVQAIKDAKEE